MPDPLGDTPRNPRDDAEAVALFARDMLAKLRANSHKAHWSTVEQVWLVRRLLGGVDELVDALATGTPEDVVKECADISNFSMFIADNARRGR